MTVYGNELAGATMQLIDSEGNIFDEWVSDGAEHIVTKLPAGSYVLHEFAAPDGFVITTDIAFTIDEHNKVTVDKIDALATDENGIPTIIMVDDTTKVHITKTDITGDKELPGARLQVIDENGNIVDEWTSTTEAHIIEGVLIAGKEYTLHEEISPVGYVVANDITFKVSEDGSVDVVVMKDETTKVRISKRDITTDEELPGAKLIIIDEDGNTVEEWTSANEAHYIEGRLIAGRIYTLRETTAPDGYEIANDIQFTVNEDGTVTSVVMYDKHTPDTPPEAPPETPREETPHNPHTGSETDTGLVSVPLAVMAICAMVMIVSRRKQKENA